MSMLLCTQLFSLSFNEASARALQIQVPNISSHTVYGCIIIGVDGEDGFLDMHSMHCIFTMLFNAGWRLFALLSDTQTRSCFLSEKLNYT